ncbi:hypothetical protein JTB14_013940 [Gonioctena quinquepunctata]|nr:hypothetical protein JTB14_013940 [Gonioctena quinquepunctata]
MKLAFIVIFAVACIFSNINAQVDGEEEHKLELRQRRSNGRPYLPRPTSRPNFNRGKREVSSEIDLEDDISELRVRRSNGRPYLPRPTSRPNFNRGKREVSSEIDLEDDISELRVEDRMDAHICPGQLPGPTSTGEKGKLVQKLT